MTAYFPRTAQYLPLTIPASAVVAGDVIAKAGTHFRVTSTVTLGTSDKTILVMGQSQDNDNDPVQLFPLCSPWAPVTVLRMTTGGSL